MAKYVFLEDWIKARSKVQCKRLDAEVANNHCLAFSVHEIKYAGLEWEIDNPKPNYTRDQLLIEIAKRLNIEL